MKKSFSILLAILLQTLCHAGETDSMVVHNNTFKIIIVKNDLNTDSIEVKFTIVNSSNKVVGIDTSFREIYTVGGLEYYLSLGKDLAHSLSMNIFSFRPGDTLLVNQIIPDKMYQLTFTIEYIDEFQSLPYRLLDSNTSFIVYFEQNDLHLQVHSGDLPWKETTAIVIDSIFLDSSSLYNAELKVIEFD